MQTDTFKDKVVVVTGGACGIGKCIADEFRSMGAIVYVIDKQSGEHFVGDVSRKEALELLRHFIWSNSLCLIWQKVHQS